MENIFMENCRLCQEKRGTCLFQNDIDLTNKIFECTKIKVNDDLMFHLPDCVCNDCNIRISDICDYIRKINRIDEHLRKLVSNHNNGDLYVTVNNHEINSDAEFVNVHECNKCPATFSDKKLMKHHLKSHSRKAKYTCTVCSETFPDLTNFNLHKEKHIEFTEKSFKNNTEKKNHERSLIEVIAINEVESDITPRTDIFECETCTKQFNNKSNLRAHIKTHKTSFKCPRKDCEKVCSTAYALKIHKYDHEGNRPYLCVTCGKGFTSKNSLTCHEKIHLDVKSYVCKLCNIGFSVRSNLRAHEKKHHEGVRFYCSQCTKDFVTKCSLNRHEKIHAGVKEFKCDLCTAAFYTNKELLKHKRYHEGIRQYKCDECYKCFFERHHLIIHLRSHTGERPYECKIPGCGKSFVDSQKLKRHHSARHNN